MAANGDVNTPIDDSEPVVNRWIVDYFFYQAIDSFKSGQEEDFRYFKRQIDYILSRQVEDAGTLISKIKILHFLSLINEDLLVEPVRHLECALTVLQDLSNIDDILHQDFKTASTSIKEMMVGILIKKKNFNQGKQAIQKHFPKPMVGKKAIFMGLINEQSNKHKVIEQINIQQFKLDMVTFCQGLLKYTIPFLKKAAIRLVQDRLGVVDEAPEADDQVQASCQQVAAVQLKSIQCSVIQRTRLEAAYNALAAGTDQKRFAKLEEEVAEELEREDLCLQLSPDSLRNKDVNSGWDQQFQRNTVSPMEASPADQPTQMDVAAETPAGSLSKAFSAVPSSRLPYSVARLVMEPDSQPSSQSTTASQNPEPQVSKENPPHPLVENNEQDGRASTPKQRRLPSKASTRASPRQAEDTEGSSDSSESEDMSPNVKSNEKRRQSRRKLPSTESDEEPLGTVQPYQTPEQRVRRSVHNTPEQEKNNILDSSIESSPTGDPPSVSGQSHKPSHSKWKELCRNAKESKETWSDEESFFRAKKNSRLDESSTSQSGHRRKMWTDQETQQLKEGVEKFGEGRWSKIKAYYNIKDRTNVQLKDRWRTMQKLKMVN